MTITPLSDTSQSLLDRFLADNPAWGLHTPQILATMNLLCLAYHHRHLLLTCGNGGSASDASHIVGELIKSFDISRPLSATDQQRFTDAYGDTGTQLAAKLAYGLRAVSLSAESVLLTAMGNDVGFTEAFAQQVYALGHTDDILLAMSTSGKSANILNALRAAKAKGLHTIGLTGQNDCPMDELCDIIFHAPATKTYRVQEYHLALYHVLCLLVEYQLFKGKNP